MSRRASGGFGLGLCRGRSNGAPLTMFVLVLLSTGASFTRAREVDTVDSKEGETSTGTTAKEDLWATCPKVGGGGAKAARNFPRVASPRTGRGVCVCVVSFFFQRRSFG